MQTPARPRLPDGDCVLFPVATLKDAGIIQGMPKKGDYIDGGATEQVFGHLKDKSFRERVQPDFEPFKANLDAYVIQWNTRKRRVKPKGLTPEELQSQSSAA